MLNEKIVGRKLFGRALRLRVALWVFRRTDPSFYQTEAAEGVRYTASAVITELDRLVELEMLREDPAKSGDRRKYYERVESPLWKIIQAADEVLGAQPPSSKGT
jgi:hypothetical protein